MKKTRANPHLSLRGAEVRAHMDAADRHEDKAEEHRLAAASILKRAREELSDSDWKQWLRRAVCMLEREADALLMLLWSAHERYEHAMKTEREVKARAVAARRTKA
jgi:hypothetical protein